LDGKQARKTINDGVDAHPHLYIVVNLKTGTISRLIGKAVRPPVMKAVVEGLNARWSQPASLRLRELDAVSLERQPLDASASRSTPKPKRLPAGSAPRIRCSGKRIRCSVR
jgi:hypothetical protein